MELHTFTNAHHQFAKYWLLESSKSKATNLKIAIKKFSNKEEVQPNQRAYQNQKIFHFHSKLYIPLELKLSTNLHEHLKS